MITLEQSLETIQLLKSKTKPGQTTAELEAPGLPIYTLGAEYEDFLTICGPACQGLGGPWSAWPGLPLKQACWKSPLR